MSTATIYSHRFDAPNDGDTGILGGDEAGVPDCWEFSVRIAKDWERELEEAKAPSIRRVALGAAMAMGKKVGRPATACKASTGAFFMGTDPELILKSRRVHPSRLLENGFEFDYPR